VIQGLRKRATTRALVRAAGPISHQAISAQGQKSIRTRNSSKSKAIETALNNPRLPREAGVISLRDHPLGWKCLSGGKATENPKDRT